MCGLILKELLQLLKQYNYCSIILLLPYYMTMQTLFILQGTISMVLLLVPAERDEMFFFFIWKIEKSVKWMACAVVARYCEISVPGSTCAGSLLLPGAGLWSGGEGAGGRLGDLGSSFLSVGARSKPFPWGECGVLPTGEEGSCRKSDKRNIDRE